MVVSGRQCCRQPRRLRGPTPSRSAACDLLDAGSFLRQPGCAAGGGTRRGRGAVGVIVGFGSLLAACAKQSPPPPPPPAAVATLQESKNSLTASNAVTATATVESINQKTRRVTLRQSDGERNRIRLGGDLEKPSTLRKGSRGHV